ncbi:MAG: nucleoside hydrolase [Verrucomicrobia bacterium]|nr:nucleoside hydrolase [Verrucomicrobiota bacterium]MCG2681067.1 nucleoside hydrolase [Kiritimatiellia bacterium]MBU4248296.1 nucleoside hydrolase [Verrucomicrobiota bacterium]MBU4290490.1 nucleoside hydrolase [Verrucomicrobiota bacterium]MBU4427873.1 nucleoside hydrolase [Verrucomicrobiota bacterium]
MDVNKKRIAVILDTDIGGDIDDTWALALMLRSPELDVKLVVSDTGDTTYRARIIAGLLEIAGRTDIPIGIGIPQGSEPGRESQEPWMRNYELRRYPGAVHPDGVQALVDTIMSSPEPLTLICIGPVPNIAEALRREPRIAAKCRCVGMFGSLRRGHAGAKKVIAEFNVVRDIKAAQALFSASWREMVITPLDTCGVIRLQGPKYQAVCRATDPLARAVIENYRIWLNGKPEVQSSILYDTVAVYLAFAEGLLVMEDLGIRVTDDGYTRMDDTARHVRVATEWKDLGAFEDFLVHRIAGCLHGGG